MGCFSCNGKRAKSSWRGGPRMCVYPDRGWVPLAGPIPRWAPSSCRWGEGACQVLGKCRLLPALVSWSQC